jgi:hypothetical protein
LFDGQGKIEEISRGLKTFVDNVLGQRRGTNLEEANFNASPLDLQGDLLLRSGGGGGGGGGGWCKSKRSEINERGVNLLPCSFFARMGLQTYPFHGSGGRKDRNISLVPGYDTIGYQRHARRLSLVVFHDRGRYQGPEKIDLFARRRGVTSSESPCAGLFLVVVTHMGYA